MATLVEAAQRIMDLYYQDYAPNDKFLDLDDFKYQIAIVYSSLLNKMYQTERRTNKAMEGFSNIEIPASWLVEETITIKDENEEGDFYITTDHPVYSFDWDNAANALQGVHKSGAGPHCVYRKLSLNERRFRQLIPPSSAIFFYLNNPTEIVFWGAKAGSKVKIQYVPVVVGEENDCILSGNIIADLTPIVLGTMFKAKNGNFTQQLDDQNAPNPLTPQPNPVANKMQR